MALLAPLAGFGTAFAPFHINSASPAPNPITVFGTDLVAWYDPSDAATVTQSGGLVSQLNDKSGNGYHLTAAGTARPAYSAAGILGQLPGLYFDGSATILSKTSVTLSTTANSVYTLSELNEVSSDGSSARFFSYKPDADGNDFSSHGLALIANGGTNKHRQALIGGTAKANTNTLQSTTIQGGQVMYCGQIGRHGMVCDGADSQMFFENESSTKVAYTPAFTSPGTIGFGSRVGTGGQWKGYMGETVIVKRAITASELAQLNAWMIRAWTRVLVCEGDSITHAGPAGFGTAGQSDSGIGGFTYVSVPNLSPKAYLVNKALAGTDLWTNIGSDLWDRTAYTNLSLPTNKYGKQYILFFTFANQICGGFHAGPASTPAEYAAGFVTYATARKADGWDKIVIATALSRTDSQAGDTNRNAFNAIIANPAWSGLAANGGPIDAVADFAADPIMGVDAAPTTNPTYFTDGVHPNALGNATLEPIFTTTINAV